MGWFFNLMKQLEGLVPEVGVVLLSIIFIIMLAIARAYYKPDIDPRILNFHASFTGWYLAYLTVICYAGLLCFSPVYFRTNFGMHSDNIVYGFRIGIAIVFILYFMYIYRDIIHGMIFHSFEYYFVLIFAMVGLSLMTTATSFLNLLLSMELYSICSYYLINVRRTSFFSTEASFKYFVISSFSTALYLFGVFLVYYGSGTIDFGDAALLGIETGVELYGYFFVIMALFTKTGSAIYYFWILDAYEGATFFILMFLNIFVKPVFVFTIFKIMIFCGSIPLFFYIRDLIFWSCVVGAIGASLQTKLKRFLVFTSIYNVGFLSFFFWDPANQMLSGFVVFFFIYAFNSFVLMAALGMLRDTSRKFLIIDIKELASVMPQNISYTLALVFLLLVLSGLPPFSFFFVKYFMYVSLFNEVSGPYLFILWITAAVATFYYVRMIRIILSGTPRPTFLFLFNSTYMATLLALSIVLNVWFYTFLAEVMIKVVSQLGGGC